MTDTEEKTSNPTTTPDKRIPDDALICTVKNGDELVCEPRKRTVGNKIFDWGVYSTIAWIGVSAVSLLTAHEAIHGTNKNFKWLRNIKEGLSNGVEKILTKRGMAPEKIKAWSDNSALFAMLGLGGTTLMAPIKWMEDNRQKLACKIDNMLGTTPPDAELIEAEPKQSWKSVLSGRAASVFVGFVAFAAIGPKLASEISEKFGAKFTNAWMKIRPHADEKIVREWANMGVFDTFFTAITASITYAFSRFVAKHDPEDIAVARRPAPQKPMDEAPAPAVSFAEKIAPRPKMAARDMLHSQQINAEAAQAAANPSL